MDSKIANKLPKDSKSSFSDMIAQDDIEYLLSYGSSSGADLVEIFIEKSNHINILAEQDDITSVSPSLIKGAGIRIFRGKRDSFVSTNDISLEGLKRAINSGLDMLGIETNKLNKGIFTGLKPIHDFTLSKLNWDKESPSINEICDQMLLGNNLLESNCRYSQVRRSSFSRSLQEVLIACTDGTFARDIRLHQTIGLSLLAEDRNYRANIGRRFGSSGKPKCFDDWNVHSTSHEVCESAEKMLYADYIEAGQMPAVLANKFGGVIFHEACGHLLETTQLERGTSPFAEKINKIIANEAVTAVDEGFTDGAFGTISIDDEGMQPKKSTLIENGVLKTFLSDRAGELRTGHKRTGSGRRQNYSFAPASRMRNTYICPGKYSPDEIISSINKGIYCKSLGGGSVGPTGQFNFSVEEAYLIENGSITKPVKGATMIGEAKEILPRISMCGNDLDLAAGFCGSISGNVNVTVGQPHIKVDSITIGGR